MSRDRGKPYLSFKILQRGFSGLTTLSFWADTEGSRHDGRELKGNKPRQITDGACFFILVRHQAGRFLWAFTHCSVSILGGGPGF
jgi:hypothetical protein